MFADVEATLRDHGIQPSTQRVAVADYILATDAHPSADQVWHAVAATMPAISRATVYNTLNLFVEKGLIRELFIAEGRVVFDPKTDKHHHFVDDETGQILDVPWDQVQVCSVEQLEGLEIRDYMVLMRGRRRTGR